MFHQVAEARDGKEGLNVPCEPGFMRNFIVEWVMPLSMIEELGKYVSEQQKVQATILEQHRLWDEEREAERKKLHLQDGGGGGGGGG